MPESSPSTSSGTALLVTAAGTYQCPRCGWLHIEVHAGYHCPCAPCDKCATTGHGQWAGSACNRCGGHGYRILPISERLANVGEVTDGRA